MKCICAVYDDFHLPVVWIEILAAQRLVGNHRSLGETVRPLFKLVRPFLGAQGASGDLGSVKERLSFHKLLEIVLHGKPMRVCQGL